MSKKTSPSVINSLPVDFASLIAPIGMDRFFSEYYGKKPLHIKGDNAKAPGLPDWNS